jgi:hypothetical protein
LVGLVNRNNIVEKLAYTLANPVAAGLVGRAASQGQMTPLRATTAKNFTGIGYAGSGVMKNTITVALVFSLFATSACVADEEPSPPPEGSPSGSTPTDPDPQPNPNPQPNPQPMSPAMVVSATCSTEMHNGRSIPVARFEYSFSGNTGADIALLTPLTPYQESFLRNHPIDCGGWSRKAGARCVRGTTDPESTRVVYLAAAPLFEGRSGESVKIKPVMPGWLGEIAEITCQ